MQVRESVARSFLAFRHGRGHGFLPGRRCALAHVEVRLLHPLLVAAHLRGRQIRH